MAKAFFKVFLALALIGPFVCHGQEQSKWEIKGYIKGMMMSTQDPYQGDQLLSEFAQSRLRNDWTISKHISFRMDARLSLYAGDLVERYPMIYEIMDNDPGIVDLTMENDFVDNYLTVFNVDRLLMEMDFKKWNLTVGRQRINWGVNTLWNPNDVFNAYDFFDFDYEERPGRDAVRFQYATGDMSFVELATAYEDGYDPSSAILYRFNRSGYDWQLLAGKTLGHWLGGLGWAGNIRDLGFKGEVRFNNLDDDPRWENGVVASLGIDRTFEPGWYIGLNSFYNGEAKNPLVASGHTNYNYSSSITGGSSLSYQRALAVQVTRQFNIKWNSSLVVLCGDGGQWVAMPSLSYSLGEDLEALLTGMGFYGKAPQQSNVFLRLKWSFSS